MKGKSSKILAIFLSFCLLSQQLGFAQVALQLNLSRFLYQLGPVDKFRPLHMRYFSFDSAVNKFDLLLDKGDLKKISDEELRSQGQELFKYFLVGLTLPNKTFWVNLRPDSQERIIDPALEKTDVGKILLEADLQLKKDTARYTSPENPQGKEYWDRLYKKAAEIFGTENITIPTLTRPWIVPNEVIIRYNGSSAYVYKATLKVMLEQDYLKDSSTYNFNDPRMKELNVYASQQVRELIIPLLNKEINQSKRYAQLRQVFYSLILAQWFKQECNNSNSTYCRMIDRYKLNDLVSQESWSKDTYFQAYKKSFEQGEYNIKTPSFGAYGQTIRSYFSGGMNLSDVVVKAQVSSPLFGIQAAALNPQALGGVALTVTDGEVRVVSSPVRRKHLPPEPVIQGGDLIANGPIRLLDAPPRRKPAQKPSGLSPAIQKALAEGRSGPGRVSMSSPVMQNSPWVTEDLLTRNASDPLGRAIGELHFAAYRLNNAGASGFVITDLERKSFMINEEMSLASASMQQSTGSPEWENLNLAVMNDQDLKSNLKHATIVVVNSTEATEPRFLLNKNIYFIPKSLLTGIQDINFLLTQLVRERNMLFVRLEQAGVVSVNQQGEARLASNAQYSQVSLIAAQAHTIILQQAAKAASGSSPANLKELTGKYGDDKSHDMMGAMEAEGLTLEGFADILAHWQNDQWLTLNVFWNSYTFFLRQRTQGPKNWRVLDGVDFEALKKEIRVNLGQRKPASRKSSSPAVVEIGLDAEGRLPVYPPELADKLKRGESAAVSISTEAVDDKTRGLKEIKQVGIDIYAPLYPDGAFLSVSDQIAVKSQLGALTAAVKDVNLVNRLKDVIEIVFVKSLGETIYVRNFSADKKNPTSSLIFLDFSALEDRGWLQSSLEAALKHIEAAASSPTTERGEDIDSVSPDFTTSAITDIINAKSQLSPSFKALAYDALERAQRKYREWIGEPHGRFSVSRVEKIRRVVEILLPGAIQELERAEPDFRLVNAILLQIMSDLQGAGEKINWRVFASRERESG
ncbi:MAG: hypothetical protein NT088_06490, partial [Candidatus Omnitrophica bacterium]|nr:hypothetical protein [Candidatus Omnitrophota bacterium]